MINKGLELVYLYVVEANGGKYNIGINLSRDKFYTYDGSSKSVGVEDIIISQLPRNFFGDNIKNVNAIVGKNGVGKTSILNVLSSKNSGQKYLALYFDRSKNSYFCNQLLDGRKKHSASELISCEFFDGRIKLKASDSTNKSQKTEVLYLSLSTNIKDHNIEGVKNKVNRLFFNKANMLDAFDFLYEDDFFNEKNMLLGSTIRKFHIKLPVEKRISIVHKKLKKKINSEHTYKLYEEISEMCHFEESYISFSERLLRNIIFSIIQWVIWDQGDKEYSLLDKDKISSVETLISNNIKRLHEKLIRVSDINYNYINSIDKLFSIYDELMDIYISDRFYVSDMKKIKNSLKLVIKLISMLDPKSLEKSKNLKKIIVISVDKHNQSYIRELIECLNTHNEFISNFNITIQDKLLDEISMEFSGFSSGEESLVKQFAGLNTCLKHVEVQQYERGSCHIVLILDEYELHLHPEWSRTYLCQLINLLSKYKRLSFQIIMATHSPYLISDLPKENITLVQKDEKIGKRRAEKSKHGFASNFYDILSDSFFLEGTIGEFARIKINGWIAELEALKNSVNLQVNNGRKERVNISEYLLQLSKIKEIFKIVGDPFIQQELVSQCNSFEQYLFTLNDKEMSLKQLKDHIADLQRIADVMEKNNDLS